MAAVTKIDSNSTELRIAEESSYGVLPGTPDWNLQEPNSYADTGQEVTTVARTPITADRQRRKGVVTDIEAVLGFQTDVTQEGLTELSEGFFFADMRRKDEITAVANVDTGDTSDDYEPAAGGDNYVANDLLFASGFADAQNNGLKLVTGIPTATSIAVTTALTAASGQNGTLRRVGFQFTSGDAQIDASGTLPLLTTSTKDMTAFDLVPGEWIFIGGDQAAEQFATAANNGFVRVRRVIDANNVELDKASATLVTDTGVGKTIRVFFAPRILKNETSSSLILQKSYQAERSLGAPDDAQPAQIQAEYIVGCVASEMSINIPTADKVVADMSWIGKTTETIDGPTSLKTGNRPTLVSGDAFNTSSDFTRLRLAPTSDTDENPTAAVPFIQEVTLTVNNNVSANKAIGVLGNAHVTAGAFDVSASLTAYFADVAIVDTLRNNNDLTFDAHLIKSNQGISIDLPLVTLGDGKVTVEADSATTLPLTLNAAKGTSVNSNLDHTMMMQWWDYLPDAADS